MNKSPKQSPWKWPLKPLGGPLIHNPTHDVGSLVKKLADEDDGGFVYRGQARLYDGRSLLPSCFRSPYFGPVFHAIGLNFAAGCYLLSACPALREKHHAKAPELYMDASPSEILPQALAQHYDFKSNLIDVTFDIQIAASFALIPCDNRHPNDRGVIFRWRAQDLFPLLHDLRKIRGVLEAASFPRLTKRSQLRPEVQQAGGIWFPWEYQRQKFRFRDDVILCAEIFPFFHSEKKCPGLLSNEELFPNATDPVYLFFEEWTRSEVTPLSLVSWKFYSLLRAQAGPE